MLEEQRERKYNHYARVIQKAFKKYFARRQSERRKAEACQIVYGKKDRRRNSLNRNFIGDYIGLDFRPNLQTLAGRREKVYFAEIVKKYDRTFKVARRDLLLTGSCLFLIGRERVKKGPAKGTYQEVIKRKIRFEEIGCLSLSTLCDDFVVVHVKDDYDSLLEIMFKTEFLSCLCKHYQNRMSRSLMIKFSNSIEYRIKKEGWGGGGTRTVSFVLNTSDNAREVTNVSGKIMKVIVPQGLPNTASKPRTSPNASYPLLIPIYNCNVFPEPAAENKVLKEQPRSGPTTKQYRTHNGQAVTLRAPPPPPSEPAPPNQPLLSSLQLVFRQNRRNEVDPHRDLQFMKTPPAGEAG